MSDAAGAEPDSVLRKHLLSGQVIPAHPLALTELRRPDEQRQRNLTKYYVDSGAGGVAVAVHTTQFALREHGLLRSVLELARDAASEALPRGAASEALPLNGDPEAASRSVAPEALPNNSAPPFALIAGAMGSPRQAVAEAALAADLGYHAVLLSLAGLDHLNNDRLIQHCAEVSKVLPLFAFYLQPAVGGRPLDLEFWQRLAELPRLVAVKIAPFNRYETHAVVRAIAGSGRNDVALYTGNDDSIVHDLLTPFPVEVNGVLRHRYLEGGLLGHWAVWTQSAVRLLRELKSAREAAELDPRWLKVAAAITDINSAVFDSANRFAGCIPGIHEVLVRQGLLAGSWTLDPEEGLSPGQGDEIDRVMRMYPEWTK